MEFRKPKKIKYQKMMSDLFLHLKTVRLKKNFKFRAHSHEILDRTPKTVIHLKKQVL